MSIDFEDHSEYVIDGIRKDDATVTKIKHPDAFNKKWSEISQWSGMNPNFRRRTNKDISKRQSEGMEAGSKELSPDDVASAGYGLFDVITPPYSLHELGQYYETSGPNHAAVDTKVANTVGLGHQWELTPKAVSKMDSKTTEKQQAAARRKVESAKLLLSTWLDELNDTDTFINSLEKMSTDLHSTGNGYLEIGRKLNGQIGYVGHIPSTSIRVRRRRDGYCQIIGNKVVYFKNYGDKEQANTVTNDPNPNELLHFKIYSPMHSYYGVPDTVSAGQALLGDVLAQQYNIDYFKNKSVPRYIVIVKGAKLSPDSEEKLFDFLQTNLKGQNHRTLLIPLPPDDDQTKIEFEMKPIEAGIQEASFEKYHLGNRNDILTAHQVPLSKIGMGSGSLAGTIASDRTFREQVARPIQKTIEKSVNKIIKEVTDILSFKLVELTLTDAAQLAQIHEKYVRNLVLTPNEVRDELGHPPIEGGDKVIDLSPRQEADKENEREGKDERAIDRENNDSDSPNTVSGRNPQGEGKK